MMGAPLHAGIPCTGRFPPSIKPVRNGVYLIELTSGGGSMYAKWEANQWHMTSRTPWRAATISLRSVWCYSGRMLGWRGLAQNPELEESERRPGLLNLAQKLQLENPKWSTNKVMSHAKAAWTAKRNA